MPEILTAPSAAGNYWVSCVVTKDNGDIFRLPSKLLKVIDKVLATFNERNNVDNTVAYGGTLTYRKGQSYIDINFNSTSADVIVSSSCTLEHSNALIQNNASLVRYYLLFDADAPDKNPAAITLTFASGATYTLDFFLAEEGTGGTEIEYPPVPVGVYPTNLVAGQPVEFSSVVRWTVGNMNAPPGNVDVTLTHLDSGDVMRGETIPAELLIGREYSYEMTRYGDYEIKAVYSDDSFERFLFSVPAPAVEPFDPNLFIGASEVYESEPVSTLLWSDHLATTIAKNLVVVGPSGTNSIDLALTGGGSMEVIGPLAPGNYQLTLECEYSDRTPSSISTDIVNLTVLPTPVSELLDQAWADLDDVDQWQAIIENPQATAHQQLVASSIAEMLDAIAGRNGFSLLPEISPAQAQNSLVTYKAEQEDKEPPLTFYQWQANQENWKSHEEQSQLRAVVVSVDTSSINALLSSFNAITHPVGSVQWRVIGTDWDFIDHIAASRKGNTPDAVILERYRDYQKYAQSAPLIETFFNWLKRS